MLAYFFYAVRTIFWWFGNQFRKIGKGPEVVSFILEGDYPEIPPVGGHPLLRRFRPPKTSLLELGRQMRTVAADPRVKGVILHLRPLTMPLAKIDVLRGLVHELQAAGKRVVTWSYTYDTRMYYLACATDEITLLPGGTLGPMGLYRQYTYLGEGLARVGMKGDFIQISPYKSAGDVFTRREMSVEVREMGNWLADATYEEIITAIGAGRKMDPDSARALIDQTPCTDLKALEIGAVDALVGEDGLLDRLGEQGKPVKWVTWESAQGRLFQQPLKVPGKYIALMSIEGLIMDGRSGSPPVEPPVPVPILMDNRAGDLSVVQTVRQIQADKRAAGVVVYVDSGGGSVTASESIRLALEKLAAQKPLIVVMGPTAASGGYWVSTPAKMILAQPNTMTGSIGVLAGKIANAGLLQKLTVHQEIISRGEHIGIYEPEAPFTAAEKEIVWDYIQRVYDLFLERVAGSRGMDPEAVDAIGRGRVWTGRQAINNGLVDELGGLNQAFERIRALTGVDERAATRIFTPGKQVIPPVADPAGVLKYAYEGLKMVSGRVMCIVPWVEREA